MRSSPHLFVAGLPCVGKSWLGSWLESEGLFLHVDAEVGDGSGLDELGIHTEWDRAIGGDAGSLLRRLGQFDRPVVLNWGFPPHLLSGVKALAQSGIEPWWIDGKVAQARSAFKKRKTGRIEDFEAQIVAIKSDRSKIEAVFSGRVIQGLNADGSQRHPRDLWAEISKRRSIS